MCRITTSRRQGQAREGLSEGSPSAKVRAEEQKSHRRLSSRASQHQMTKPTGTSGQGKCGGCALKAHVLIRGDLSDVAVRSRVVGTSRATGRPRSRRRGAAAR